MPGLKIVINTDEARIATERLKNSLKILGAETKLTGKEIKALESRMIKGMGQDKAKGNIEAVARACKMSQYETARFQAQLGDFKGVFQMVGQGASTLVSKLTGVHTLMLAMAGGYGFKRIATSALEVASSFEKMQVKLDTLTKGRGEETLKRINEWALRMPVDTREAVEAFVQMQAMGLDPTINKMQILTDVSSIFGDETLGRVSLALGQMSTLGRVSAQDLNQLAQSGINARKYLREAFGMSVEEIQAAGIEIDKVIDVIWKGLETEFGGAAEKLMGSWSGITETTKSFLVEIERMVMDAGVFDSLKETLTEINKELEKWVNNNQEIIKQQVPEWVDEVKEKVKGFYDFILEHDDAIAGTFLVMLMKGVLPKPLLGAIFLGGLGKDAFDKFMDTSSYLTDMLYHGKEMNEMLRELQEFSKQGIHVADTDTIIHADYEKLKALVDEARKEAVSFQKRAITGYEYDKEQGIYKKEGWQEEEELARKKKLAELDQWKTDYQKTMNETVKMADYFKTLDVYPLPEKDVSKFTKQLASAISEEKFEEAKEILTKMKEAADKLNEKWKETRDQLGQEINMQGMDQFEKQAYQLQVHAEDLKKTFGDKKEITSWLETMVGEVEVKKKLFQSSLKESELMSKIANLSTLQQEHLIDNESRIRKEIESYQELLEIREKDFELLDKHSDASSWYKQQEAITETKNKLLELQNQLMQETGTISEGWKEYTQDFLDQMETAFDEGYLMAEETAKAMKGAFSDFFFDAMRGEMKSLGDYIDSFLQTIQRALADIMAQRLVSSIVGGLGGIMGGANAGVESSAINYSNFSLGTSLPGRAEGGDVRMGTPYWVGERGPEVFIPQTNGSITPNSDVGGVTVNQSISIDARGADSGVEGKIRSAMQQAKIEAYQMIHDDFRRRGLLRRSL